MNLFKQIKSLIIQGAEIYKSIKIIQENYKKYNSGDNFEKGEALREILENGDFIERKTKRIKRKVKRTINKNKL